MSIGYKKNNMNNFIALFFCLQSKHKIVTKPIIMLLYIEFFYMSNKKIVFHYSVLVFNFCDWLRNLKIF
jgi:hypothetical protein